MKKSVKLLIALITALAVALGAALLSANGRRAEAMYGGAVLVSTAKAGQTNAEL